MAEWFEVVREVGGERFKCMDVVCITFGGEIVGPDHPSGVHVLCTYGDDIPLNAAKLLGLTE